MPAAYIRRSSWFGFGDGHGFGEEEEEEEEEEKEEEIRYCAIAVPLRYFATGADD
jgi:hypothetical protein